MYLESGKEGEHATVPVAFPFFLLDTNVKTGFTNGVSAQFIRKNERILHIFECLRVKMLDCVL